MRTIQSTVQIDFEPLNLIGEARGDRTLVTVGAWTDARQGQYCLARA